MTKRLGGRVGRVSAAALALMLLAWPAGGCSAQNLIAPVGAPWPVEPDFAKSAVARQNLSGAACAPTQPPFRSCLAVNDEKKYAQLFSIDGRKLTPSAVVRLSGEEEEHDPDAEGAAYADGYFYVIGSHARSRRFDALIEARFAVFRFPVDRDTGQLRFTGSDDSVVGLQKSTKVRAALRGAPVIGPWMEQPLPAGGVNIEGLAVGGGRMFLGLRAPSVDGRAFIVAVAVEGVFGEQPLDLAVHALPLGPDIGIRDLAPVSGGLLVLSGATRDEPVPASIFRWDERSGAVQPLAQLTLPREAEQARAEALLLLEETPEHYRVLVMFDGVSNGAPTEYRIPR